MNVKNVFTIGVIILFVGLMISSILSSQYWAKNFGGTTTIDLPKDRKLINVTWKDGNSIWFLTRQRKADEPIEKFYFQEKSNLGIVQGTVVLNEH